MILSHLGQNWKSETPELTPLGLVCYAMCMAYLMKTDETDAVLRALRTRQQSCWSASLAAVYADIAYAVEESFVKVLTDREFCLVMGALVFDDNIAMARLMGVRYADAL